MSRRLDLPPCAGFAGARLVPMAIQGAVLSVAAGGMSQGQLQALPLRRGAAVLALALLVAVALWGMGRA